MGEQSAGRPLRSSRTGAAGVPARVRAIASAVALLGITLAGCGYSFVRSVAVPADVRTVLVRVELPERSDPLIADALAREMRRVLRWNGRFRPVESGKADAELVLHVTTDRIRAVAFDEFDQVLDYQATIAVNAQLRRSGDAVLWSAEHVAATRGQAAVQGAIVTSSSSFQGGDIVSREDLGKFDGVQLGEERKIAARDAVLRDLAETVYSRMTEGF
jgi:outer membrane lipopolysaccharide assembly protein LptE/RlpB